jgi:hypothetical protein
MNNVGTGTLEEECATASATVDDSSRRVKAPAAPNLITAVVVFVEAKAKLCGRVNHPSIVKNLQPTKPNIAGGQVDRILLRHAPTRAPETPRGGRRRRGHS